MLGTTVLGFVRAQFGKKGLAIAVELGLELDQRIVW